MKIIKRFIFISLIFIICLINQTKVVASSGDLDYIHEYIVKVDPRYDGTLDIEYRIKWEVLNDTKDGPLTWIVVGIPNVYVDELTPFHFVYGHVLARALEHISFQIHVFLTEWSNAYEAVE